MLNLPKKEDLVLIEIRYEKQYTREFDNTIVTVLAYANNKQIHFLFEKDIYRGIPVGNKIDEAIKYYTHVKNEDMETYKQFIRDLVQNDNFVNLFFE